MDYDKLLQIRKQVAQNDYLIHCITNHISINDCANIILAVGAKPIMAEHSEEVAEITKASNALGVNLGNISDERMKSIMISGNTAYKNKVPSVIDLVGVGCSKLRLEFSKQFIKDCKPAVIKGNMSEIKALCGINNNTKGIDVNKSDIVSDKNLDKSIQLALKCSNDTNSVIAITGEIDIIAYKDKAYLIYNGHKMLSETTGTGCMLNALIAAYISSNNILNSTILATLVLDISGELSSNCKGIGSFKIELFDNIYNLTDDIILQKLKLEEV